MLKEYCSFKRIYIACGYTDLRNGIDGLASIIQNSFSLDPFDEGTLFLFCGRKTEDIANISVEQYHWLLEGMAIIQRKTIQKVERKMIL